MSIEGKRYDVIKATAQHTAAAKKVSEWVSEDGNMLPKSVDEVIELFSAGRSVLAVEGEEVIGHVAATFINSDNSIEIGALFTDQGHRGKGVAHETTRRVVQGMHEMYPESMIYALANERSAPVFLNMGAREMNTNELPDEVWEACETCPRKPEQEEGCPFKCCDTPYDLTPILRK